MLKTLLVLVLGLYLAILGLVTFVGLDNISHSHESARNTVALCSLRDNIRESRDERVRSIARSERFLKHHPRGIPGVPIALIHQGLADSRLALKGNDRNLHALRILRCG